MNQEIGNSINRLLGAQGVQKEAVISDEKSVEDIWIALPGRVAGLLDLDSALMCQSI